MDGPVYSLTVYDGSLVAGGSFSRASDTPVGNIARWDGSSWHDLGEWLYPFHPVGVHEDKLIAYNGSVIRRWDGSDWQTIGQTNDVYSVETFGFYQGDLLVAGWFRRIDDTQVNGLARWDGTQWHPVGIERNGGYYYGLAVYRDDLVVAGTFTTAGDEGVKGIARWDGSAWHKFGRGMNNWVTTFTEYKGDLVAAGEFTSAGDVLGMGRLGMNSAPA